MNKMQTNHSVNDTARDIYFLNTTKLKAWQNPVNGDTANFKILRNDSADRFMELAPQSLYRCYTHLDGDWCFQGIFAGIDRFNRLNNLDN